jgi:hypothetical protein
MAHLFLLAALIWEVLLLLTAYPYFGLEVRRIWQLARLRLCLDSRLGIDRCIWLQPDVIGSKFK